MFKGMFKGKEIWTRRNSSMFFIFNIRSMIRRRIHGLAPSIRNSFCHGSSRNRSQNTTETLRLIPESAALPLISSSFSRFFFLVSVAAISSSSFSLVSSLPLLLLLIFLLFTPPFSYFSRCTSSWGNRLKVPFTLQ